MKNKILLTIILLVSFLFADGLLMPENEDYPKDFLRNRMTRINLSINGLIAETAIYQEFLNEWNESTDVVFSYPLPDDAKATKFLYWYEDKVYEAILKVQEQSQNPGHGESEISAQVTKYIGRNGIKISLKGVKAGEIQKTELHYISTVEYNKGKCSYEIPLNTEDFITFPYDNFEMNVNVKSNSQITAFDIPEFDGFSTIKSDDNELVLSLSKPKFYPNKNISFEYTINQENLNVDFFSVANDSTKGHFGLFVKPPVDVSVDSLLPKRIIFLLSNSYDMYGVKIEDGISCIKDMLDGLKETDEVNIIAFANNVYKWNAGGVSGNADNITTAKNWLDGLNMSSGSNMQLGLESALSQITDDDFNNIIVPITGGFNLVDPLAIAENNTHKTGIFPIGLGDDLSYAQLEMTAAENYGFVTYIEDDDNLYNKIDNLWSRISRPILKNIAMEYGGVTLSEMLPEKIPSYYSGSYFFTTGRYDNSGNSALSIGGNSVTGFKSYDFQLDFSADTDTCKFIEKFWAKSMIDKLEWQIEIYGETPDLKQQLIDLSLLYNIRCIYTAYIADYKNLVLEIEDENDVVQLPKSFIAGNYPNPFNPTTKFKIYINDQLYSGAKLLKIYDIQGRLVAVIDISHLQPGWNSVVFNGCDAYGNRLPSGVYIATLQVGNQIISSVKINLLK